MVLLFLCGSNDKGHLAVALDWGLTWVRPAESAGLLSAQALLFFLDFLLFLAVSLAAFFLAGASALGVAAGAGVGVTAGLAVTAGAATGAGAGAGAGAAVWAMAAAASKLAKRAVMDLIMSCL